MTNIRLLLAAGGTFLALTAPSLAADPPVVPTPIAAAKTLRCKETFSVADREGVTHPMYTLVAEIARTGTGENVRLDMVAATEAARAKQHPSAYVLDGKKEVELNGLNSTYTIKDAPQVGKRSHSQLRDMAAIDLVLHPDLSAAAEQKGTTKAVTTETLDGKAMVLTTYSATRTGSDGKSFTNATRFYVDATTGLPYRRQDLFTGKDGNLRVNIQTDFSDWEIDPNIAAKQFVWSAPVWAEEYTGPKMLAVGTPAPDFTAYAPDGKPVKLSDMKGKVVVLDFWATWCGPCQKSMPHLETVYNKIKDQNVTVLAVCVWDTKPEYDKWLIAKKGTYSFPTVFDTAGRDPSNIAGGKYKVTGIPTQYIIDKEGRIAAVTVGYEEGDHFLEKSLAKLGVTVPGAEKKVADAK